MTLIYLALAYGIGLILGRFAWQQGLAPCAFPTWLWVLPMVLLPLTALVNPRRVPRHGVTDLRWPEQYGFVRPGPPVTAGMALAILCALLAGFCRYAGAPIQPCLTEANLSYYNLPAEAAFDTAMPDVEVQGYVASYVLTTEDRQRFQVAVDTMTRNARTQPLAGVVMVNAAASPRLAYGQPVRLQGRLAAPPEFPNFSYRAYLARRGIHSVMYSPDVALLDSPHQGSRIRRNLYVLRKRSERLLNRILPEPFSALANGILLGVDAEIPAELEDAFTATGTSHVLVISGSNVALLAGLTMVLLGAIVGRRRAVLPVILVLSGYASVVGGDAAVVRAALMGGLVVVAVALRRRSTALVALATACWAMTLAAPATLWDVGFQLSAAATVGLITVAPRIQSGLRRLWPGIPGGILVDSVEPDDQATARIQEVRTIGGLLYGLVVESVVITVAANIMVAPLLAYYFGRVSLLGMAANILIAPVQPLIMAWGSAGIILGAAGWPDLAQIVMWIPWLGLYWTVFIVETMAQLPGASLAIDDFGPVALWVSYVGIFFWLVYGRWWSRMFQVGVAVVGQFHVGAARSHNSRLIFSWLTTMLAVGSVLVWWGLFSQPDGRVHVWFLDVGQGDGIFIQTPSGRQILVDGGQNSHTLFAELGEIMPFWDRDIDILVLTHPDGDHMHAQLAIPDRYQIGQAIESVISQHDPEAEPWHNSLATARVTIVPLAAGSWLDLGDGVALWALWPGQTAPSFHDKPKAENDNDNSLVLKLVYGNLSLLLTGDAGRESETQWLRSGFALRASVLKVGHHGSASSTGPSFVAAVDPVIAVIQAGKDNAYGHPVAEVLENLAGRRVFRTDLHGRVHLFSDGSNVWVEAEHRADCARC